MLVIINTLPLASAIAIEDTGINPFGDIYNRHCFSWSTVSMCSLSTGMFLKLFWCVFTMLCSFNICYEDTPVVGSMP